MEKFWFVSGDIGSLNLGLSKEDYEQICKETTIIFHIAATVRFDEALKLAVNVNVRGTREVVLLAKQCPQLAAFLHVSTAYSNCIIKNIEEKFYDSPMKPEKLINLVDTLDEDTLQKITPILLGEFPNTYAYTKVAAENVIREMAKGLPLAVIRPSIIVGTAKEPIGGWIDNVYGPTGVVVGAGIGLLHSLHCDENEVADIIPVDYVINACLVITYEIAKVHETPNKEKLVLDENGTDTKIVDQDVPIYNYVSSNQKPLLWKDFMRIVQHYGINIPSMLNIWIYALRLNKNYTMHVLYVLFFHFIPAYIVDGISYCMRKKPRLVKAYQKINKFSNVISYFCTQRWYFKTDNVQNMVKNMSPGDEALFECDISGLNWEDFLNTYVRGIRVYLIKDPMETVESAQKRYRILKLGHFTICTVVILSLIRMFMFFIKLTNIF
ncbi:fatty acyl-CoA reductase wat-like isoform X2 [Arctopsyche grandis]